MIDYDHELENGWDELGKLVLSELRRLANGQDVLTAEVSQIKTEVAAHTAITSQISEIMKDHEQRIRPMEAELLKSEAASGANKKALTLIAGVVVTAGGWIASVIPNLIHSGNNG